jgi:hypothetical protein
MALCTSLQSSFFLHHLKQQQVQYLTHTSIQLYSKDTWCISVCKIPKNVNISSSWPYVLPFFHCTHCTPLQHCEWKLELGIEFENFVLAFVSKELSFSHLMMYLPVAEQAI